MAALQDAAVWRVVGGEDRGGILARKGQELTSPAEVLRLATGAVVQERELVGERLHFRLVRGAGPAEGWASVRMHGKDLMVKLWPTDQAADGLRRNPRDGKVYSFEELVTAFRREYTRDQARRHWELNCIPVDKGSASGNAESGRKEAGGAWPNMATGALYQEVAKLRLITEAMEREHREEEERAAKREKARREKEEEAKREEMQKAMREMDEKRALDLGEKRRLLNEERARRDKDAKAAEDNLQRLRAEKVLKESERAAVAAARAGSAGTCSPEVEARFRSLERLVDQQQVQLDRLGDFCGRLLQEVSDLHVAHTTLHASHCFMCDCLNGSRLLAAEVSSVVLSKQVRQRGRLGARLNPVMRIADDRDMATSLWQLLGDQGAGLCRLSQAARPLLNLRQTVMSLSSQAATGGASAPSRPSRSSQAHQLDDAVWSTFKRHEPTSATLLDWEKSQTVQAVIGNLRGTEGVVGKVESVRFSDVHTIFAQIGLSLDHFVNKFRHTPQSNLASVGAKALEATADAVLRKFAVQKVDGNDRMSCKDLYRMLELIGYPLHRFKAIFPNAAVVQDNPGDGGYLRIGGVTIRRQIGQGFKGARCYLGEQTDGTRVALKWPAPLDEVSTVKDIVKKAKDCIGIPRLLGNGTYQAKAYLVTELLGSPLTNIFERIHGHSIRQRWFALRIIGRLLIRRLQAFHGCGYVHCDISPENVLMGRAQGDTGSNRIALFLIDFELAQRYPGGSKVEGNIGSAEWSSIRSADVVERIPEDDLEALGWVLLNGLVGSLPWFDWLGAAYRDWESKWTRAQAVKQVQRGKLRVLEESSAAAGWRRSVGMPEELLSYLRLCRTMAGDPGHTKYSSLSALFGGDSNLSDSEAEKRDLEQFARHVLPLL